MNNLKLYYITDFSRYRKGRETVIKKTEADPLMSTAEVAARLRVVSARTITAWANEYQDSGEGILKGYRIGRRKWGFLTSDVEALLKSMGAQSGAVTPKPKKSVAM